MSYQQIEDYGIIGNLRTAALIAKNGSVDWFWFPRFDSPSVFGLILDQEKGGYYRIYPLAKNFTLKQLYWPETNVLVTRFLSEEGAGEVIDFMPVSTVPDDLECGSLIRTVKAIRGSMRFCLECYPAFNYARDPHRIESDGGVRISRRGTPKLRIARCTRRQLQKSLDGRRVRGVKSTYRGRWREVVMRSALALKLLTYHPTSASMVELSGAPEF